MSAQTDVQVKARYNPKLETVCTIWTNTNKNALMLTCTLTLICMNFFFSVDLFKINILQIIMGRICLSVHDRYHY